MKRFRILPKFLGILGAAVLTAGLYLSFTYMQASPVLVEQPMAAIEQADALLDAVCRADMSKAGSMFYGRPSLGVDRDPADAVGNLLWGAFVESLEYELVSQCYATDSGVALDVSITALDLDSVTSTMKERSQVKLEQRVAAAKDADDVYDENGDYREDFVMQVLYDSTVDALAQDARTTTKQVTLSLVYDDGQWWVMPESQLLDAISGGLLK